MSRVRVSIAQTRPTGRTRTLLLFVLTALLAQCICRGSDDYGSDSDDQGQDSGPGSSAHKFVSGVYSERLPSPIFYDTYIPIIFEYQLPGWNKSEVTFNNWYSCESDSLPYKSCAVMYHLNKAISNLHIDFESLQPVQDTASHTEHYETLYQESGFCDTIQPHFSGIFIQEEPELERYIDKLGHCRKAAGEETLQHVELVPDFKYDITMPYNRIEMNFYEMFYKPINASSEILATAVLANSRSNIQATLLATYYAEKFRWVHALQDCQRGLLPHSLISLAKLNATLHELAAKARFKASYEYAIDLDLISKYYSLPLTDCTYTNDSLIVRLLFPINYKTKAQEQASTAPEEANTKANSNSNAMQLFRLQSVPFRYENHLCSVNLNANAHPTDNTFLYDTRRRLAYSAGECRQNSLCSTSTSIGHLHPAYAHPCATALVTATATAEDVAQQTRIRAACKLKCTPYIQDSPQEEMLVTRVAPDKYILTGGPTSSSSSVDASLVAVCGGKPIVQQLTSSETQSGAIEITLPCNCNFMFVGSSETDKRKYFSDYACNSTNTSPVTEVTLVHIDPWHFVKNGSNPPEVDLDLVSQYTAPVMTMMNNKECPSAPPAAAPPPSASSTSTNDGHTSESQSLSVIWAPFLVAMLLLLTLQIFVLYKLRLLSKSVCYHTQFDGPGTGTTNTLQSQTNNTMENLLYYKVTGRSQGQSNGDADTEPEIHLLRNA